MNGFETHIFEKSSHPGGVCQSWNRNGYSVNGSFHWLMGSGPGTGYYQMWRELGVIENTAMYHHRSFYNYENQEGKILRFFTDVNRLRGELLQWAPEDGEAINEFCDAIQDISNHPIPFPQVGVWNQALSFAKTLFLEFPLIVSMVKWQPLTLAQFANRFTNPDVKNALLHLWHPEMSMVFLLVQFAFANMGSASYPLGGSGRFIDKLFSRFQELSGHFHAGAEVEKIEIQNSKVVAIRLKNGIRVEGEYFISAADGYHTLFNMIDPGYLTLEHKQIFEKLQAFPGLLYFSAGFEYDFHNTDPSISGLSIALKHPVDLGHGLLDRATFQIYNFDPTLAGAGKTLVTALIPTDYDHWKGIKSEGLEKYREERNRIGLALIENLEIRFPGIRHKVSFMDLATPLTYESETGNYRGSYEGWLPSPESIRTNISQKLPKVKNLFLSGHWVSAGGGMPPAAFTARNAVAFVCDAEEKEFTSFTT
jgi:phytoene dehydrogenase-like protein